MKNVKKEILIKTKLEADKLRIRERNNKPNK